MASPYTADGHRLIFKLDKDQVVIERIDCPHDGGSRGVCNGRGRCLVKTFIGVYGLDFCVGEASIDGPVEIAWLPVYGESDLDLDVGGIYFTPVGDPGYVEAVAAERFAELAQ